MEQGHIDDKLVMKISSYQIGWPKRSFEKRQMKLGPLTSFRE